MESIKRILVEREMLDSLNARILSIEICLSALEVKLKNELEAVEKIRNLVEQSRNLINQIKAEPKKK